jgi:hypothetical protein
MGVLMRADAVRDLDQRRLVLGWLVAVGIDAITLQRPAEIERAEQAVRVFRDRQREDVDRAGAEVRTQALLQWKHCGKQAERRSRMQQDAFHVGDAPCALLFRFGKSDDFGRRFGCVPVKGGKRHRLLLWLALVWLCGSVQI